MIFCLDNLQNGHWSRDFHIIDIVLSYIIARTVDNERQSKNCALLIVISLIMNDNWKYKGIILSEYELFAMYFYWNSLSYFSIQE